MGGVMMPVPIDRIDRDHSVYTSPTCPTQTILFAIESINHHPTPTPKIPPPPPTLSLFPFTHLRRRQLRRVLYLGPLRPHQIAALVNKSGVERDS